MNKLPRHYLFVPYNEDLTRSLRINHKIRWDKDAKLWYTTSPDIYDRLYLFHKIFYNVPYSGKDIVKKYGYRWDGKVKAWYGCEYVRRENLEDLAEFEPINIPCEV